MPITFTSASSISIQPPSLEAELLLPAAYLLYTYSIAFL
jgi:hypothetical protein